MVVQGEMVIVNLYLLAFCNVTGDSILISLMHSYFVMQVSHPYSNVCWIYKHSQLSVQHKKDGF